jgi:endonuclease YncB( thermonuclease family)
MFPTGWQLRVMGSNRLIFYTLAFALFWSTGVALAATLSGTVVGVSDGDTITVLDAENRQHKIRVAGIDAPERNQPFGLRSKENLSRLVFGKEVDVQWSKHDRYQRVVGKVLVAQPDCQHPICTKTLDAGLAQIAAGFAWWYRKYANEQSLEDADAYEAAEQQARAQRIGLWRDAEPMPPWDWRRKDDR